MSVTTVRAVSTLPLNTEISTTADSDGALMSNVVQNGITSTGNTSTATLAASDTYTGTWEQNALPDVGVSCHSNTAGTLYFDFSNDGTNVNTFPVSGFTVSAGIHEFHIAVKLGRYFRVRFVNSASDQTYFRLYTYYGSFQKPNAPVVAGLTDDSDATTTRSILTGRTDGGQYINVPVTAEGHLEVALHAPRLPFGSIHTENLTPIFQTDGVYGVDNDLIETYTSGSGTAGASDSALFVSTGATVNSQATLQSRKRLRYRAGQGVVGRFAGYFLDPVANSYQLAGLGHGEDGFYFGYGNTNDLSDTRFGILYVNRGVRATYTLTVTTGATGAGNVTITLNGTAYTVAVTASSNIQRTVYEISQGTFNGWTAEPRGATVVFVRGSAGATAGAFSFAAGTTGSVASIAQTKAGAASTDLFIPQEEWNGDVLDGTGSASNPSGILLDPQKGNVYQIGVQYLGFGGVSFQIETVTTGNNPDFTTVHIIEFPNTRTTTTLGNPSFPFTIAAYSAGSTTDVGVKIGSFGGFIEGQKKLHGPRMSYYNASTGVTNAAYHSLFTILNTRYYNGRSNQAVVNIQAATGAVKHNNPVVYYLIKNGALVGNPNFSQFSTKSCTYWDTSATTITFSDNSQILWSGHLGETGDIDHKFDDPSEEFTLQPGETITLAARSLGAGSPTWVTGSINTREDQ